MISKVFRLKENEVKKVLQKKYAKPFFSYSLVLNTLQNKLSYNRFSIIIWSKSVNSNISRNFFRRLFYEESRKYIEKSKENIFYDFSILIKKETKLDKRDQILINNFKKDLNFVFSKFYIEEKSEETKQVLKINFKNK